MTEEDMKTAVREAVKEAVRGELDLYGFTTHTPIEMQQDMVHLRKLRLGCEATKSNIARAVITVTIPAVLFVFWEALKGVIVR